MDPTNTAEGIYFPLAKFSSSAVPVNHKGPMNWNHFTQGLLLILLNFRPLLASPQSVHAPHIFKITENRELLEECNIDEQMQKNQVFLRATEYATNLNAEALPTFAIYRAADWQIAICYPLPNESIRRFQLKFTSECDFLAVRGYLLQLNFPTTESKVQLQSAPARRVSTARRRPETSYHPKIRQSSRALSQHQSSVGSTSGSFATAPSSQIWENKQVPQQQNLQPSSILPRRSSTHFEISSHEPPNAVQIANKGAFSTFAHHSAIHRPTIADLSATTDQIELRSHHFHNSDADHAFRHNLQRPASAICAPRHQLSHDDGDGLASESNTNVFADHENIIDKIHAESEGLTQLLPPRRELPFSRPASRPSSRPSSAMTLSSADRAPVSGRLHTITEKEPSSSDRQYLKPVNDLSGPTRYTSVNNQNRPPNFTSAQENVASLPPTTLPRSKMAPIGNFSHSSSPAILSSSTTMPSLATTSPPISDAAQERRYPILQHANSFAPATNVTSKLPDYMRLPKDERRAQMNSMILELIDDNDFITLCEDMEQCWRRIGLPSSSY